MTGGPTKTDEFSENHIAVFPEFMTEEPFIMAKICNINFWIGKGGVSMSGAAKILALPELA